MRSHAIIIIALADHVACDVISLHHALPAPAPQVDEVKTIMVENIEKVLERGEKLEVLQDKTDDLRFQVGLPAVASAAVCGGRSMAWLVWWPGSCGVIPVWLLSCAAACQHLRL